jgi:hypothetical protein
MTTIGHFERALGRQALWAPRRLRNTRGAVIGQEYVQRLRVYPHALREPNAYYSPERVALLFGYFPASSDPLGNYLPGGTIFTCLSHDIIAHETTHALLDGMHRRFIEATHPDNLAFHEAFADVVALLQHFTFPEVLRHEIAETRGNLRGQTLLGQLAQQFGEAIGHYGALRDAIGLVDPVTRKWHPKDPDPTELANATEPHERGAILVGAVFDAFVAIYNSRTADLVRIATSGTGELPSGELHPDLVNRLANEAAKAAEHVLGMCIRALDYCPPVSIEFGEYLRALITADSDLIPDDDLGYRVAFIEAFRRRGIYPRKIRTLSEDSLRWQLVSDQDTTDEFEGLAERLRKPIGTLQYLESRADIADRSRRMSANLHSFIKKELADSQAFARITGLALNRGAPDIDGISTDDDGDPAFEVHSVRGARRVGPDGQALNQVIISLTQKRVVPLADSAGPAASGESMTFRGGCTLILDLDSLRVRYAIRKPVADAQRLAEQRSYLGGNTRSLRATYFAKALAEADVEEPFALLHRGL